MASLELKLKGMEDFAESLFEELFDDEPKVEPIPGDIPIDNIPGDAHRLPPVFINLMCVLLRGFCNSYNKKGILPIVDDTYYRAVCRNYNKQGQQFSDLVFENSQLQNRIEQLTQ